MRYPFRYGFVIGFVLKQGAFQLKGKKRHMFSGLLTTLLVINGLVLIVLIIALQHGNEGGMSSALGSGNASGFFGASGGVTLIVRTTWVVGILFFILSTALAWTKTHDHFGVGREIQRTETPSESLHPEPSSVPLQTSSPTVNP